VEALLVSTGIVALAEMGDKTQLLALLLAARFRKPLPIIAGILFATLLNHGLAGAVGVWVTHALGENVMRWVLGFSFLAMAVWILIPDRAPETQPTTPRLGVFGTTLITFFFLEMGDKTQIATVALAAEYPSYFMVVAGTTLGMMLANVPAVMLGDRVTQQLPIRTIQIVCALIFAALGVGALAELTIR
jgi:putative Ca2+/H+ antiporter (TMEM165/GDT1 family)